MHVDLTVFSDVMVALVLYYLLFFLLGIRHVPVPDTSDAQPPLVVIVVPARNEELVIEETTRLALSTSYRGPVRVLVVDDASSDATASLVVDMAVGESRLRLLRRSPEFGGVGKSEVLNHAYAEITHWVHAEDPWLLGYTQHQIILGVIDADGHLSPGALNDVTAYFRSRRVGAVQISVHIREVAASCLARLQDIELVGYSYMTQTARDRLGSVGLGGNGQFMRLSALASLGPLPWHPGALTEDLDLGIRMMIEGWHLRVCSLASVDQQGLSGFRPLLRQRTRWAQGAYQCWRLLPGLARSPKLWVATRGRRHRPIASGSGGRDGWRGVGPRSPQHRWRRDHRRSLRAVDGVRDRLPDDRPHPRLDAASVVDCHLPTTCAPSAVVVGGTRVHRADGRLRLPLGGDRPAGVAPLARAGELGEDPSPRHYRRGAGSARGAE